MRILNVTETYAPFLEFGGPPVKVRALSEGLARRGHTASVLTADWGQLRAVQDKRVFLVDGDAFFNRPGPRLVDSVEMLAEVFHPVLFPKPAYEGKGWERI